MMMEGAKQKASNIIITTTPTPTTSNYRPKIIAASKDSQSQH
jgi:hypothetical protein